MIYHHLVQNMVTSGYKRNQYGSDQNAKKNSSKSPKLDCDGMVAYAILYIQSMVKVRILILIEA